MYQETIGVIRDVAPSLSDKEILENIQCERIKITKVERIQKFVQNKLTPTYSVKIYAEGEKLPQEVVLYTIPRKVEVYMFPPRFCLKCLRYGHNSKICKSEQSRCSNCSLSGHEGKDCKSLNIVCFHCKENHKAFDMNCKERHRQDAIRKAMTFNKLSFDEAAKLYPRQSQTQQRLQSLTDFPPLASQSTAPEANMINEMPPPTLPPPVNYKQAAKTNEQTTDMTKQKKNDNSNYITKDELTQIVNKLKIEIVKQLNLNKLINKIQEIRKKITENITDTNDSTKGTDNKFLISISEQLNDLINPEVLQPTKPPNK